MNENEFEFEGKTYVAKPYVAESSCNECAMFVGGDCIAIDVRGIPDCYCGLRKDGMNVIFVEKQQ